ncbi:MAG: SAM-dependent methyltransferase [Lachnospiraceae bacterium]|nr:SAM-dependent methyltransferase [Lachnospiraceae bacterium]
MLKISDRLATVASLIPVGANLVDIGTDHGYVPIWLLQNQRIASAIAMDVNKGPLARAKENRDKYGFSEVMDLRLSNGFEKLQPGEGDSVLIAGMGGPLMIRIIEEGRKNASSIQTWVLQPQSEIPSVRRYLHEHDFIIVEEIMLKDEGKYYMAMKAVPGKEASWNRLEYLFGKYLLEQKHSVLKEFIEKETELYKKISQQLIESNQTASERYQEVVGYLEDLKQAMTYYD